MNINTDGLIIKEQNVGEKDRLVTVLTKQEGIIRAFVKGANIIKSPLSSSTQLLCYSHLCIYKGRNKYIINEAKPVEIFFNIRKSLEKLVLSQYFCELALALAPEGDEAGEFLRLILNSLYLLSNDKKSTAIIKSVLELKLISISGYMPDLVGCYICGKYKSKYMYFSIDKGVIICNECCKNEAVNIIKISLGVLTAMRHIIYSDLDKLFSFNLSEKSIKNLSSVAEKYLLYVLNKDFKTLNFYKSLNLE